MRDSITKQYNTYDCGPICCLRLMHLFERTLPQSKMSGEMSTKKLQVVVVKQFSNYRKVERRFDYTI
jgi:hypothetical protein